MVLTLIVTGFVPVACRRGDSQSSDAVSSQPAQVAPDIPKEEDIFAVTLWNPKPVTVAGAIAKSNRRSGTQTATDETGSSTKAATTCWLLTVYRSGYWKDRFNVTEDDVRNMLKTYHRVSHEQWKHFSHVGGGERSGWLILNDGRGVQWMTKPGGLGWLRFPSGEMIYLSKTSPWQP